MPMRCKKCQELKDGDQFYKYRRVCKKCYGDQCRQYKLAHPEKILAYRAKARSEKEKAKARANAEKQRRNHPEQVRAHLIAHKAVESGEIKKTISCECCGKVTDKLCAHHHDYDKPLEVVWIHFQRDKRES